MKQHLHSAKDAIISFVDLFYAPFSKFIDKQTYRYAACGGMNTLFDIFLYYITYHYIIHERIVYFAGLAVSPHIAAFVITFPVTFLSGFLLMRYVVFPESSGTRKRVQLPKYLFIVFICIMLNYGFLKLFVETFGWWPLPSKIVTTVFVVTFSYLSQKNFTFKKISHIET